MEIISLILVLFILTVYFSKVYILFNEVAQHLSSSDIKPDYSLTSTYIFFISGNPQINWISGCLIFWSLLVLSAYTLFCAFSTSIIPLPLPAAVFLAFVILCGLLFFPLTKRLRWLLIQKKYAVFYPAVAAYIIVFPLSVSIAFCLKKLLQIFVKRNNYDLKLDITVDREIDLFLKEQSSGNMAANFKEEITMMHNAMDLFRVKVRDCMIPRTDIEAVEMNTPLTDVEQKFITTGYSRLAVYKENMDNIIGFINCKDIFKNPGSIKKMLNNIAFVPETMPANRLLHEFMQEHRAIAVVVDEYGGTSGLITLEDIMEEIFGDIEDEHDTDDLIEKKLRNDEYIFSGRLEIEYLNARYHLNIPEHDEYDTLAGYILFASHNLPKPKQKIEVDNFIITILKVSNTRIDLVSFKLKAHSKPNF